jgi:ADP-ribose pyrophosphatase YjhB (NUDIX family)
VYCIQCGTKLVPKQVERRERPVCPACGHVAYQQLKVGAGAMVEQSGSLLLVQRGLATDAFPGTWNLPAGYCEADEAPEMTAVRETAEETGLEVRAGCLAGVYYFDDDPRGNGLLLLYEAEVLGGKLHSSGNEAAGARFFPPEDLPELLCGGGHDQAIRAWRARALDRWHPGAPLRYCPHCAHPLEQRMTFGQLRLACPACGFVHFRSPKVGVSVLVEENDQVLLVQRAIEPGLGKWCLPSGFVEWNESPQAAAVRECAEETGLIVSSLHLLDAMQYTADYRGPGINLTYRGQVAGGVLCAGDDAAAARFFAANELPSPDMIAFATHRYALEHWQATNQ